MGPHSSFVHGLLEHLERVGFDGAPRFLGVDEWNREMLSLVHGAPMSGTATLGDGEIVSAAALLRRYHDAAATMPRAVLGSAETVVHGDPGPWNMLWVERSAVALIDFDEARPGRRLDDLGYFAWKGLRLVPTGPSLEDQRRRLAILAGAYGVHVDDSLLDAVENAVAWLKAKGNREAWPTEALRELEDEGCWLRERRSALVGSR
jgi:Ser/Thr protein kinase RdoA (MazF antagonist)